MPDESGALLRWQSDLVTDALGMDEAGGWTSYEVVELLARQNGKGVPIEAMELFGLRETRIVHSAHRFATAQEAFKRLVELIDSSDWLRKWVKQVNRSHGSEGVTLLPSAGGGELLYKARSAHGVAVRWAARIRRPPASTVEIGLRTLDNALSLAVQAF